LKLSRTRNEMSIIWGICGFTLREMELVSLVIENGRLSWNGLDMMKAKMMMMIGSSFV